MSGSLPVLMLIRRQCRPLFSALTHFASHSAGGSGRDSNSTSGNFDEGDGFVLLGGGSSDNTSKTPTLRCRSCEKLLKNLQTSTCESFSAVILISFFVIYEHVLSPQIIQRFIMYSSTCYLFFIQMLCLFLSFSI